MWFFNLCLLHLYSVLAHGGEQDGQVGTQAPTGEAFNNYFVICLEADSRQQARRGTEASAVDCLEPGRVQAVWVG